MLDHIMLILVILISFVAMEFVPETVPFKVGYLSGFSVASIWLIIKFIITVKRIKENAKDKKVD